ncbi:MAG: hypothetical protein HY097_07975 [Nitrospinae bacterium]|nr:hypothetical protein [Nitrospinota bacterium]
MKCPKCGYVSFEYLDTCRKCGRDLSQFKSAMGVAAFTPGVINVLKYAEGSEEEGETETLTSEAATAVEEAAPETIQETALGHHLYSPTLSVEEAAGKTVEETPVEAAAEEKGEIEITLPEEMAEPQLEAAEVSPPPAQGEEKGEIEFNLEIPEEKEEIELTLDTDEQPAGEKPQIEIKKEEQAPVEEITLSLEDIAGLEESE